MGQRKIQHLPTWSTTFNIITTYKPLSTLFNKATANLPPRIEKWVMAMQDVDIEMKYVAGKDEQGTLDFWSRNPLLITNDEDAEHTVKAIINDRPSEDWFDGIERAFRYFKIADPIEKKDALIIYGGKDVARANGESERVMQFLNKTEQIAQLQGKDKLEKNIATQDMLIAYRSTPHPATGVSPYEAMNSRTIRTINDEPNRQGPLTNERDERYKARMNNN
eukprot:gene13859-4804_t